MLYLPEEMLAAAEADFQPHILRGRPEQRREWLRRGPVEIQFQARQCCSQQVLLAGGKSATDVTTIDEPALYYRLARIGPAVGCNQLSASLIGSTRSSFSQEKPPSASGLRPKWP